MLRVFFRFRKLIFLLILIFHSVLLFNLKFTAWPEIVLWPYLILKGWLPYQDIAIAHTPVLLADLAIFGKIFGVGLVQLKVYTWLLILITDAVLYFVAKKLWNYKIAVLSLLIYVPLQIFYDGNGLWFDLALAPLALLIYFCLKKENYLWVGIWWGIAFFTKQTAFWFLFPIFVLLIKGNLFTGLKTFIKGIFFVLVPGFVIFYALGFFPEFLFWALRFGIGKLPVSLGQIHLPTLRQFLTAAFPFALIILAKVRLGKPSLTLVFWSAFGALGVFPRWELFHFQPALPFVVISLATVVQGFPKLKISEKAVFLVGLGLFSIVIARQLVRSWRAEDRFFEKDTLEVSSYVKNHTKNSEEIFVLNAWDNIYVLSGTLPATRPWVPHLAWYLELPGVQEEMVADLSDASPNIIVKAEYPSGVYRPLLINEFISGNYEEEGQIGRYRILKKK